MGKWFRLTLFGVVALCGAWGLAVAGGEPTGTVVVVPITGQVDDGMAHLVDRAVDEANTSNASALILDINTPGGLVSSAMEIRDAMFRSKVPTIAYVSERAFSAGALITLSAKTIAMAPGASVGAAEPIPNTPKLVAALRSEFASTAARNHRDANLASAMVDKSVDAPAFKKSGAILSLTTDEAIRAHIADRVEPTLSDLLRDEHLGGVIVHHAEYTFGEQLARFATTVEVSGLLLSIGVLGLLIEMQTLHGIAGLIGVGALGLFFGTHVYSGFSNGFVIVLAIAGVIALLFELHVLPGHGVSGILGAIALIAAVFLSFGVASIFVAAQAISIAIVLTALFFWGATRIFPENAFIAKLTFSGAQGPEYVASADFRDLLGKNGVAASFLRPAGVAEVEGRRITVLTEGEFVPAGSPISVSRVEGARIFVRPIMKENA